MWNTWHVASLAEELDFQFDFILILTSVATWVCLMATALDDAGGPTIESQEKNIVG
jgi:hypothetical protein